MFRMVAGLIHWLRFLGEDSGAYRLAAGDIVLDDRLQDVSFPARFNS